MMTPELKELEAELQKPEVETKSTDPMDSDEVAIAAGHYGNMCKSIKGYARAMGGKGLARVMVALAEFPYAQDYPKFRSDAEQKLFTYMLSIQSAKAIIAEALKPSMAELKQKAEDGIVQEQMATIKGETTDGNVD